MKRYLLLAAVVLLPFVTFAADPFFGPIVPQCAGDGICDICDFMALLNNLLRFAVAFAVMVSTLMFVYAGILYVTASTAKANIDSAKRIFWNVFLGLVLILAAWLIVDLVMKVFTGQSLDVRTQLRCDDVQKVASPTNQPGEGGGSGVVADGDGNLDGCADCVQVTSFSCKNPNSCLVSKNVNLQLTQLCTNIQASGGSCSDYRITETGVNQTVQHASGSRNLDIGCAQKNSYGGCSTEWFSNLQAGWSGTAVYETNSLEDYNEMINAGVSSSNVLLLTGTFVDGNCDLGPGKCITAPHASLK